MKQKNDLFEELNINPKNRDVCSPFAVDIQAIKRNVNRTLDSAYTERKTVIMKSKKKTACIALAATLALSVTAFAANGLVSNWFSSSSSFADYKTLPTAQQVKKDIGYTPILIDSFANGYAFQDGNIISNNLTDENEALSVENSTLSNKVTVLSETVSKKAATEDAISQETVENALPKGFPLSGSATMEEATEGDPMLVFTAAAGVNVLTTGTGVVLSVDADTEYGTKIVVDHGNGYCSVYRNNGTALVKAGEELGKGYILFTIGEDNQKLGYQIMKDDAYIDPMSMIDING